jgi:rsbT antagonist protein RsbS
VDRESVSVVKVREILIVTVPSDPDDSTVGALQEQILMKLEQHQAKGVVLDISAVETLDSFFARTVAETAQMIGVMGGRTIVVGMRPAVAITTTQIGLALGRIETALTIDRALDRVTLQSDSPDEHRVGG